jgi:hypothetical protein
MTTTQPGAVQRTDEQKAEDKAKADAYNTADKRLRDAHRDELNGYIAEEFQRRNLTWKKRLTEAERAEKTLSDLLAAHPELKEKFVTTV